VTSAAAAARATLAAGSKSFALAGKILPGASRDDAAVVYAFCRRADDLVDLATPADAAAAVLRLRAELDSVYGGGAQTEPALVAFQEVIERRRIPHAYPAALIDGMATDARPTPIVFATMDELLLYSYRVAGTVGLMMCHVMGVAGDHHLRNAAALGMAMQLTNIARDVAEDWQRGRIYVPATLLVPARLEPAGPLPPEAQAAFARALPPLLAEADRLYHLGDAGLGALGYRAAIAVRTARLAYSGIGIRVARRRHDVTAGRAVLGRGRKLWLLARAALEVTAVRAFAYVRRRAPLRLGLPVTILRFPDDVSSG
jgi:phytoene synthase